MPFTPPPTEGQRITEEFLGDVAQAAYRPITGAGVHSTPHGHSIAIPQPIGILSWYTGTFATALASTDTSLTDVTLLDSVTGDELTGQTVANPRQCSGAVDDEFLVFWNDLPQAGGDGQFEFVGPYATSGIRMYSGTLPGALANGNASLAGCTLTAIDGGVSPSGTQTVYNPGGFAGASSAAFRALYNQATSQYEFVWVAHTAKSIVTAWVDNETDTVTVTTQTLVGMFSGSTTNTAYTADECAGA